jgi:hypothetical protein
VNATIGAMHLHLPTHFNDGGALQFTSALNRGINDPTVVLDFRTVQFVYPYGTMLVAQAIKQAVAHRRVRGMPTEVVGHNYSSDAISYLRYFGFFRYINVDDAREDIAPRGGRYLPLTVLNRTALASARPNDEYQAAVEECSQKMARVIFPGPNHQSAIEMLSYCFTELVRNTFEHAEVFTCAVMAQRWDNGVAEVAVADRGIGVMKALAKAHRVNTPDEAVRLALRPGITSRAQQATGSKWDNAGFGLYVVSQLGQRFGAFSLLSSERHFTSIGEQGILRRVPLPGTLVKLRVSTKTEEDWCRVLTDIMDAGEREAKSTPGATTSAGRRKSNSLEGWG